MNKIIFSLLALAAAMPMAQAQDGTGELSGGDLPTPPTHESHLKNNPTEYSNPERPIKVYVSLYGFAARLDGDLNMGPLHSQVDVPFSDTWRNLDTSYMAYLDVQKDRFGAYIDKQYVKTKQKEQVSSHGIPVAQADITAKLDRTSAGIYYTALDTEGFAAGQRFVLEPTIGVHFTTVSANMNASTPLLSGVTKEISRRAAWNEPYIGTRFLYDFDKQWNIAGQIDIGTRNSLGYQTYLGYRSKIFNLPTNFRVGYRMIDQQYTKDDFRWKIKEHGPVIGFSMQLY